MASEDIGLDIDNLSSRRTIERVHHTDFCCITLLVVVCLIDGKPDGDVSSVHQ